MLYPLTCTGSIPIKIRRSYTDVDRRKLSFRINYVIYIYWVCSTRESLLIKPYKAEQEQNVSTILRCVSTCAHMKWKNNKQKLSLLQAWGVALGQLRKVRMSLQLLSKNQPAKDCISSPGFCWWCSSCIFYMHISGVSLFFNWYEVSSLWSQAPWVLWGQLPTVLLPEQE